MGFVCLFHDPTVTLVGFLEAAEANTCILNSVFSSLTLSVFRLLSPLSWPLRILHLFMTAFHTIVLVSLNVGLATSM